jgi:hypothetical protein
LLAFSPLGPGDEAKQMWPHSSDEVIQVQKFERLCSRSCSDSGVETGTWGFWLQIGASGFNQISKYPG